MQPAPHKGHTQFFYSQKTTFAMVVSELGDLGVVTLHDVMLAPVGDMMPLTL